MANITVAQWIRRHRLNYRDPKTGLLGISQTQLAARARVSLTTINRAENGKMVPEDYTLVRLADFFGVEAPIVAPDPVAEAADRTVKKLLGA